MAQLAGQFAGILRIEVPDARAGELVEALRGLEGKVGLRVMVEAPPARAPAEGARRLMELDLVGLDRPGIVREIARALVEHGVNIEELVTDRSTAPMTAELLFRSRARLAVPARTDPAQLRARLEKLAADLVVQVTLADPAEDGGR
jgi:glycine cleavage system regulatory protein